MTSKEDILTMANTIFEYFKNNKTYPKSVKVKGVDYTIQQATYLMNSFVTSPKTNIDAIKVGGASSPQGDRCNLEVINKIYTNMAERCHTYISNNKKLPNYVTIDGKQKCSIILWMLQLSKIIKNYKEKGNFPAKILINSNDLVKPTPKPQ